MRKFGKYPHTLTTYLIFSNWLWAQSRHPTHRETAISINVLSEFLLPPGMFLVLVQLISLFTDIVRVSSITSHIYIEGILYLQLILSKIFRIVKISF